MTLVFESLARPKLDVAALRKAQRIEKAALNCAQRQMQAQQKCQMESQWQVELASFMQQHLFVQERLAEQEKLLQAQANEVLGMSTFALEANGQGPQTNAAKANMVEDKNKQRQASINALSELMSRAGCLKPERRVSQQESLTNKPERVNESNLSTTQGNLDRLKTPHFNTNQRADIEGLHLFNEAYEFFKTHQQDKERVSSQLDSTATFESQRDAKHHQPSKNSLQGIKHKRIQAPYLVQTWLRQTIVQAEQVNQQQRHQFAQSMSQQHLSQSADSTSWLKPMEEELAVPQVSRANRNMSNHDVNQYFKYFAQLDEATIRRIADIFAESYAEKVQQNSN